MNYESKSDQIYINLRPFTVFILTFFSTFAGIKSLHNLFFKIAQFLIEVIAQQGGEIKMKNTHWT